VAQSVLERRDPADERRMHAETAKCVWRIEVAWYCPDSPSLRPARRHAGQRSDRHQRQGPGPCRCRARSVRGYALVARRVARTSRLGAL